MTAVLVIHFAGTRNASAGLSHSIHIPRGFDLISLSLVCNQSTSNNGKFGNTEAKRVQRHSKTLLSSRQQTTFAHIVFKGFGILVPFMTRIESLAPGLA